VVARELCLAGKRRPASVPAQAEVLADLDELPTEELVTKPGPKKAATRTEAVA
jgi:hypothetical protein